jgi:dTDP-4-dehydrorhamnose reductase
MVELKENRPELAILGGSGFVGGEVKRILEQKGVCVIAPGSLEVDVLNEDKLNKWAEQLDADIIALFAAKTQVDAAEDHRDEVFAINIKGARNVADVAKKYGKHLIFISTDYVFPGTQEDPGPYTEDHPVDPQNPNLGVYARSKAEAEKEIEDSGCSYSTIRISAPIGDINSDKDFIAKLKAMMEKGYKLIENNTFNVTYIPDLAEVILKIANDKLKGKFHVVCQPPTSALKLGQKVAFIFGMEPPQGVDFNDIKTKAPRPQNGGLNNKHTRMITGLDTTNLSDAVYQTINGKKY